MEVKVGLYITHGQRRDFSGAEDFSKILKKLLVRIAEKRIILA